MAFCTPVQGRDACNLRCMANSLWNRVYRIKSWVTRDAGEPCFCQPHFGTRSMGDSLTVFIPPWMQIGEPLCRVICRYVAVCFVIARTCVNYSGALSHIIYCSEGSTAFIGHIIMSQASKPIKGSLLGKKFNNPKQVYYLDLYPVPFKVRNLPSQLLYLREIWIGPSNFMWKQENCHTVKS